MYRKAKAPPQPILDEFIIPIYGPKSIAIPMGIPVSPSRFQSNPITPFAPS